MLCPTRFVGDANENSKEGRVQLPHWFMILHSSLRHLCTYICVRTTYDQIYAAKKEKETPPEVRS